MQYFAQARAALGDYADADLELTVIDRNLAMLTPDVEARTALVERVWERLRDVLGEQHPATIDALLAYAEYVPDPAAAYDLSRRASEAYHRYHPTLVEQMAIADTARAALAAEIGDLDRAVADYEAAITATQGSTDLDIAVMHDLLTGELAVLRGAPAEGIAALTAVRDRRLASERWYEREEGLRAEAWLGLAELARGRETEAARHLEVALAGYPAIIAVNEQVRYRRVYARTQRALASILRRANKDAARADALDREATAFYQAAGPGYRWAVDPGSGVSGPTP
jgi:hypothetical protein